jgi:hypothetical protein
MLKRSSIEKYLILAIRILYGWQKGDRGSRPQR